MYIYDTHVHTSQASDCALSSGAQMAQKYKELGYDGIFITDHFFHGNTCVDRSLPWADWVRLFCQGYEDAKKQGEKIGLDVFFGWEYSYQGSDLLTYGLDKEWLTAHPEVVKVGIAEYFKLIHESGGFIVHAHPFREAPYIHHIQLFPRQIDGVEIINASHKDEKFNERAEFYAKTYNLPVSGGSDSHTTWSIAGGGIETEEKITSADDYLRIMREGKLKVRSRREDFLCDMPKDFDCDKIKRAAL